MNNIEGTDVMFPQGDQSREETKDDIEILTENRGRAISSAWKAYLKYHCLEMSWTSW